MQCLPSDLHHQDTMLVLHLRARTRMPSPSTPIAVSNSLPICNHNFLNMVKLMVGDISLSRTRSSNSSHTRIVLSTSQFFGSSKAKKWCRVRQSQMDAMSKANGLQTI
jgi:hypothetical protein